MSTCQAFKQLYDKTLNTLLKGLCPTGAFVGGGGGGGGGVEISIGQIFKFTGQIKY